MLKRKENGKLQFDTLSMNIVFDDLFGQCQNAKELEFVTKCIIDSLAYACSDMRDCVEGAEDFELDNVICEYYGI